MQFLRTTAARARFRRAAILPLAIVLAACGGSDATGVSDGPTITVNGVTDGATYTSAVTITFAVDKGSFHATLDDAPFTTGTAVQSIGTHVFVVTAQIGTKITTKTVHFTIQGSAGGALIIRMLDLGSKSGDLAPGDAIVLTDSTATGKESVVIDAGPAGLNADDFGYMSRKLTALGIDTVSFMLLTHAHGDHYGGMATILTTQKVKRFLYNGQVRSTTGYQDVLTKAHAQADSVIIVNDSIRTYSIGYGVTRPTIKFLRPLQTYLGTDTDDGTQLNEGSVGARLDLGAFNMFFTGDSEVDATRRWRQTYPTLTQNITVLKVGHHGANNAIFDDGFGSSNNISTWLDWTTPEVSIISGNGTTHPRKFALARLQSQFGNTTYCTNTHGMITIVVQRDGTYSVSVEKMAGQPCQAPPGITS